VAGYLSLTTQSSSVLSTSNLNQTKLPGVPYESQIQSSLTMVLWGLCHAYVKTNDGDLILGK
jgi:hypothetical protein